MSKWTMEIWRSLDIVSQNHKRQLRTYSKQCGLSFMEARILLLLYTGGGRSLQELSKDCSGAAPNLSRAICALQAKGLLHRKTDAKDHRSYKIFLTKRGYYRIGSIAKQIERSYARLFTDQIREHDSILVGLLQNLSYLIEASIQDEEG